MCIWIFFQTTAGGGKIKIYGAKNNAYLMTKEAPEPGTPDFLKRYQIWKRKVQEQKGMYILRSQLEKAVTGILE